jgi:hypothetical protein
LQSPEHKAEASASSVLLTGKRKVGLAVLVLTGLMELGFMSHVRSLPMKGAYGPGYGYSSDSGDEPSVLMPLLLIVCTTFIPALLLVLGHSEGNKALRIGMKSWLLLVGVGLLGMSFLTLSDPRFQPMLLVLGFLTLVGTLLLGSETRARE